MHAKYEKGVTLVELMVVIAVIAILAIAAMPSYRELLDRYRVGKAAEDVVSLISNARSGAVKLHRQVAVSFATDANWCVGANSAARPSAGGLALAATTCSCASPATCLVDGENLVIPVGKHPGVKLTSTTGNIVFDGLVGATTDITTPHSAVLESPAGMFTVTINVTPLGQANTTVVQN